MSEPLPPRAEVRATAAALAKKIQDTVKAGGNPFHVKNDLLDEQVRYADRFGTDKETYIDMLADEVQAIQQFEGAKQQKADQEKLGKSAQLLGVVFGLLIGVPLLFRACS